MHDVSKSSLTNLCFIRVMPPRVLLMKVVERLMQIIRLVKSICVIVLEDNMKYGWPCF